MKTCVYGSVCDKIVQNTEPYRKENLPMIRYGTIGTNFIVDHFQEAAMENPSRLFQKSGDSQQLRGKIWS